MRGVGSDAKYDKFSYASHRSISPTSPPKSPHSMWLHTRPRGVAEANRGGSLERQKLHNSEGRSFAVAEDGRISSRFVSPIDIGGIVGSGSWLRGVRNDAWTNFLAHCEGTFDQNDVALLPWKLVFELAAHFGIVHPMEVAKIRLAWQQLQKPLP